MITRATATTSAARTWPARSRYTAAAMATTATAWPSDEAEEWPCPAGAGPYPALRPSKGLVRWVLTPAGSRKARLIEAAGRFTLMVERVMPTVRYVSVEGPVTRMVPGTDALLREIATRYLPPDKVRAYIEWAEAELGEQVAIYLRPERWLTADLGPGAVPPRVT
jgi:hypothetical protein